ncbi:multiple epidermal growth factor-like domains protein 9 [Bombina bombina]|uniref:multiple epidermal growth factor-like domains protein 9 n=1 Tax=Bombina bombina TaxID=8345 RepID=UPI00235AA66E|nr:multiple epidermal growth factor-like domains protein 9 [Bombina bombina]
MDAPMGLALFWFIVYFQASSGLGSNTTQPEAAPSVSGTVPVIGGTAPENEVGIQIATQRSAPGGPASTPEPTLPEVTPSSHGPAQYSPSLAPSAAPTTEPGTILVASSPAPAVTVPGTTLTAAPSVTSAPTETTTHGVSCNCSVFGSRKLSTCNSSQCDCIPGYEGLSCDICSKDFYLHTASGFCLPCNCSRSGAAYSNCSSSGNCSCKYGATGPKCDKCRSGFYTLPQDSGTENLCDRCPCSTVSSSGTCHLDNGKPVCDKCKPGYVGLQCDRCDNGYYSLDAICHPCKCNGNVDPVKTPEICNKTSGSCLQCINNTRGQNCEKCLDGYTGDALHRNCVKTEITTTTPPPTTTTTSVDEHTTTNTTFKITTVQTVSSSTSILTTSSSDNSTSSLADVSWTQFNIIILTVIIVVVVLLMGFVGAVYMYREYQSRKLNAPFWTIELKEDNISFSSYHDSIPNADVSGLLEDDASEMAPNGQLSLTTPIHNYKV